MNRLCRMILEELQRRNYPKQTIRKYRAAMQFVDVDDAGVLTDFDDPDAYRELTQAYLNPINQLHASRCS
jgi:CTP:molybdopterin cytidylyltransferase MocA